MHNMSIVNDMVNILLSLQKVQVTMKRVLFERDVQTVATHITFDNLIKTYQEMFKGLK